MYKQREGRAREKFVQLAISKNGPPDRSYGRTGIFAGQIQGGGEKTAAWAISMEERSKNQGHFSKEKCPRDLVELVQLEQKLWDICIDNYKKTW